MKKHKNILMSIIFSMFGTVVAIVPANADGETIYCHGDNICSTTPPKPTDYAAYAVVDSSGKVINVISGDIRDLGGGSQTTVGQGCENGCNIILQKVADPVTGNAAGFNSSEKTEVKYNSSNNTFVATQNNNTVATIETPEVVKTETSTTITSVDVLLSNDRVKTDTTTVVLKTATINASEIILVNGETTYTGETLKFNEPKTQNVVTETINNSSNRIMKSRIERIMRWLGEWFI